MIVWRGWGFVAAVAVIVAAAIGMVLKQATGAEFPPWVENGGIWAIAAILTAGFVQWRGPDRQRVLTDKASGRDVVFTERNDLFWVPLRYWVWIFAALAVVAAAMNWGK